jgi:hypothetical protein
VADVSAVPLPVPQPPVDPKGPLSDALLQAQLDTAQSLTRKAQGSDAAAEAKDFAAAALSIVQAIIILDPALSQGGTPLVHDLVMQDKRNEGAVQVEAQRGANAVAQAKVAAAAPTPAKRKSVSVRRDGHGRATEYSVEG